MFWGVVVLLWSVEHFFSGKPSGVTPLLLFVDMAKIFLFDIFILFIPLFPSLSFHILALQLYLHAYLHPCHFIAT